MKHFFSEKLKEARGGMTKSAFAQLIGIKQNTYLRYEDPASDIFPQADVMYRIVAHCKKPIGWFFETVENPVLDISLAEVDATLTSPVDKDALIAQQTATIAKLVEANARLTEMLEKIEAGLPLSDVEARSPAKGKVV